MTHLRGMISIAPAWKLPLAAFLSLLLLIFALFHEALASMVGLWLRSATYGHGFLIPLIAIWLVYRERWRLAAIVPVPSLFGLLWLAGGVLVWLAGYLTQADILGHAAIVLMIQGAALAVFGIEAARLLVFPLAYLLFMVPFGDFAIAPLQEVTADYTTLLLRLSGIPVYLENWVLIIPGGTFLVAEACAGVRYLIACIALGALISGLMFRRWWKRLLFMGLSILVPIFANVFRAYGIVMLAHLSDFEVAVGVDHLIYGFFFLSLITLVLIAIAMKLRDPEADTGAHERISGGLPAAAGAARLGVFAGLSAVMLVAIAFYGARAVRPVEVASAQIAIPAASTGWLREDVDPETGWGGNFYGADAQATAHYRKGDARIAFYAAYYAGEHPGKELVSHRNSLLFEGTQALLRRGMTTGDAAGSGLAAPGFVITRNARERRLVWYWYLVGGRTSADPVEIKLASLLSKLTGGHGEGGAVAIAYSLPVEGGDSDAEAIMREFIAGLGIDDLLAAGEPRRLLDAGDEGTD